MSFLKKKISRSVLKTLSKQLLLSCLTSVFLLCTSERIHAQNTVVPVHYDQYFKGTTFINPATMLPLNTFEGVVLSRITIGPYTNVNSSMANAMFGLRKKSEETRQAVGLLFQNENEGAFITRNRLYAIYAQRVRINSSLSLSAGGGLGLFSYGIHGSTSSSGGSSLIPDGNIGIILLHSKWSSGISVRQIFQNKFTPISTTLMLQRFISAYGHYRKPLNNTLTSISLYYTIDYYGERYYGRSLMATINVLFTFQQTFETAIGYRLYRGCSLYMGLKTISLGKKELGLGVSLFMPINPQLISSKAAEFSITIK